MRIPEGYVLVPTEPTEKMVRHGDMSYSWSVAKIYKAMAAAAPHVELQAYDEAKERELFDRFLADGNSCGCNHSMWTAWLACAKSREGIQP